MTRCKLIIVILTAFVSHYVSAQTLNKIYDSALAKQFGADEYGMKTYVMAILKTGTAKDLNQKATDSIFTGHMNNIKRLAEEGKLVVAGPLKKNAQNYQGIFIFNVSTLEEGRKLVENDPAVQAHVFDCDLFVWYGSAAMMQVPDLHKRLQKKSF